jgi:chorismate dehydratase
MISKVPWEEVKSILLDRSSMTSVLLGQLLLREGHGIAPRATLSEVPLKAAHDFVGDEHDAFVLIGDEALRLAPDALPHRIDLGEGWKQLTGLPFVFAVWALAEPGAGDAKENRSEAVARILTEAAVRGLRNLDAVSDSGAKRHGLPLAMVRPYLAGSIRYGLGPHEQEAVAEFGRRLMKTGLLKEAHPLRIAETRTAEAGRGPAG